MLGRVDYAATVQAMQDYTATRTPQSPDVLLTCEHDAVYTQGLAGKKSTFWRLVTSLWSRPTAAGR